MSKSKFSSKPLVLNNQISLKEISDSTAEMVFDEFGQYNLPAGFEQNILDEVSGGGTTNNCFCGLACE